MRGAFISPFCRCSDRRFSRRATKFARFVVRLTVYLVSACKPSTLGHSLVVVVGGGGGLLLVTAPRTRPHAACMFPVHHRRAAHPRLGGEARAGRCRRRRRRRCAPRRGARTRPLRLAPGLAPTQDQGTPPPTPRPGVTLSSVVPGLPVLLFFYGNCLYGRVVMAVGCLPMLKLWRWEVLSFNPDRGTIVERVFSPTSQLVRFSHPNMPFFSNS